MRENGGIWPGILPVRTLFRIGIGVVIFVSDREKYCLLCDLAFYVFQVYMEGYMRRACPRKLGRLVSVVRKMGYGLA